jgi:hypothetical protein
MLAVLKKSRWSAEGAEFICAHRWDVLFDVGTSSFREFAAVSGAYSGFSSGDRRLDPFAHGT